MCYGEQSQQPLSHRVWKSKPFGQWDNTEYLRIVINILLCLMARNYQIILEVSKQRKILWSQVNVEASDIPLRLANNKEEKLTCSTRISQSPKIFLPLKYLDLKYPKYIRHITTFRQNTNSFSFLHCKLLAI